MRSSAYNNSGTRTPLSVGASMSVVSSRCFSSPSTYSPNSVGLNGHPCFTPIRHLKMADKPCDDRTAALSCAYRDLMLSKVLLQTPSSCSTCHSTARGTVSNAFLKSTKQQYSLPASCPNQRFFATDCDIGLAGLLSHGQSIANSFARYRTSVRSAIHANSSASKVAKVRVIGKPPDLCWSYFSTIPGPPR